MGGDVQYTQGDEVGLDICTDVGGTAHPCFNLFYDCNNPVVSMREIAELGGFAGDVQFEGLNDFLGWEAETRSCVLADPHLLADCIGNQTLRWAPVGNTHSGC